MNRKKTILFAMLAISMTVYCGCDKNQRVDQSAEQSTNQSTNQSIDQSIEQSAEQSTDQSTENQVTLDDTDKNEILEQAESVLPIPDTNYVTAAMQERSNMGEGNLARLAAVMRKAKKGEEITVGVIGGSITQGSSSTKNENSYAYRTFQWWVQAFPEIKVNFVNAGIGGTNSYLGVHRVDRDVLSFKPDIVVVEYSVNDSNTVFYKETYEDLIRKILKSENNPAVILLFTTMEDGTSAQTQHLNIGFIYELQRISYREAVLQEIKEGAFTWKDISPDNIHPNDRGHAMIGELMWNYLNSVLDKVDTITDEVKPLDIEPIFREAYGDATILDSETLQPIQIGSFEKSSVYDRFKNNWTTTTGEESIIFETEAMNIGIMYYKTIDGKSGQYEVYIDGVYTATLNADFTGGWGNYADTVELYKSKQKQIHTIEIRKAKDATGDVFSILGLLIS